METELRSKLKKVYTKKYKSYLEYRQKVAEVFGNDHNLPYDEVAKIQEYLRWSETNTYFNEYLYNYEMDQYFCKIYSLLKKHRAKLIDIDSILTDLSCWFYFMFNAERVIEERFLKPDGTIDGLELYYCAKNC